MSKKFWKLDDLIKYAKGKMNMPQNPKEYDILNYPHWALFSSIHTGKYLTEQIVEQNMAIINKKTHEQAQNIRINDLIKEGVKL